MNVSGQLFQRAFLEHPIGVIDGSSSESLPTPTTMDHLGQQSPEALKKQMEGARKERTSLSNLREAVNPQTQEIFNSLLPTPRASEPGRTNQGYGDNLKEGICKQIGIPTEKYPLLPTPRAAKGMNMKLSEGMAKLEYKKYLETEIAAKIHTHGEVQNTDSIQTGGDMYLNPAFVEEMMGYPIGWTDLKH